MLSFLLEGACADGRRESCGGSRLRGAKYALDVAQR